ncbi:MAG TPA: acyltransferase [Xanthobacteraceae bacterium]|jgi:peptidoglycan/LPS O-acetylase OafA/YrhL|nr:acyltransferase [Xanthobacteraceae bacterium]
MNAPPRTHSLIALDILRGLAAIEVMLVHTRAASFVEYGLLPADQQTAFTAAFYALTRLGMESVLIFFVLSGFLVGGQIVSRLRSGTFVLRTYAIDRLTRIFLPLVPACLFTAAIDAFILDRPDHIGVLLGNMAGLNGILVPLLLTDSPLWTLPFEIWFYITGGALGYIIASANAGDSTGRKAGSRLVAFIVVVACICVFSVLPARYVLYWGMGALATFLLASRFKACLAICGAVILAAGIVLFQLALASRAFASIVFPKDMAETIVCVGVFCLLPLFCSASLNQRLGSVRRIAGAVSGFSYSLYLFHYPTNVALNAVLPQAARITPHAIFDFGLRAGACVLVAGVAYMVFERNTPTLRRYLTSFDRTRAIAAGELQPVVSKPLSK